MTTPVADIITFSPNSCSATQGLLFSQFITKTQQITLGHLGPGGKMWSRIWIPRLLPD